MVDQVDGVGGRATSDDVARGDAGHAASAARSRCRSRSSSTIAVTLGIAQPAEAAPHQVKRQPKAKAQTRGRRTRGASSVATTAAVPAELRGRRRRHGQRHRRALRALDGRGARAQRPRLVEPDLPGPAARPAGRHVAHRRTAAEPGRRDREAHRRRRRHGERDRRPARTRPRRVLRANGLGRQSLIFPGETIVLPSTAATSGRRGAAVIARTVAQPVDGRRHARRRRGRHAVGPGRTSRCRGLAVHRRERARQRRHHPPRPDAHRSEAGRRACRWRR